VIQTFVLDRIHMISLQASTGDKVLFRDAVKAKALILSKD
jgi:hypothetical protein